MLTEHFIASVGPSAKPPGLGVSKDAAIFLHEFQPLRQQRQILKKSATPPNCLAISTTHIFAAQADKGVVHVYGREKGNQEAIVPFTEKITAITLACNDLVLILGTTEGRIFLWEIGNGRQISTTQSHLQAITTLTVDPTQNFLLSGSKDSTINVWSIPSLLSFSRTSDPAPLQTFSNHHDEVSTVVLGNSLSSCNFAVSASRDRTVLVWDYRRGNVLRTYLLPSVPLCLDLDPADRAVYVGYEDGTLQQLDLYASSASPVQAVQNRKNANEPIQPSESSRWRLPDSRHGAVTGLGVSFDGSMVLSGHQSGSILAWDVARGSFVSSLTQIDLPGPVNNLQFLPVTGFTGEQEQARVKVNDTVKPKFGAFDNAASGSIPGNYFLNLQFPSQLPGTRPPSDFLSAVTAPSLPAVLLDQGLSELAAHGNPTNLSQINGKVNATNEEYMAIDEPVNSSETSSLKNENESLKQQLEALRRVQKKTFEKMDKLSEEKQKLLKRKHARLTDRSTQKNSVADEFDVDDDDDDDEGSSS